MPHANEWGRFCPRQLPARVGMQQKPREGNGSVVAAKPARICSDHCLGGCSEGSQMTLTTVLWLCFYFFFSHISGEKRVCQDIQVLDKLQPAFFFASESLGRLSAFFPYSLRKAFFCTLGHTRLIHKRLGSIQIWHWGKPYKVLSGSALRYLLTVYFGQQRESFRALTVAAF